MRYWWVNHNQTFRQEFEGGYIWCPKKTRNNQINHFYETVREVAPGDIIFSFANTRIQGFGFAKSSCYSCPKPDDFGHVGDAWDARGWRVDVDFKKFASPIRPIDFRDLIAPLLPKKYAPIRAQTGYGNQGAYFSEITKSLASLIVTLCDPSLHGILDACDAVQEPPSEYIAISRVPANPILEWEDNQQKAIESSENIPETTRIALIAARRGQGLFKQRVSAYETACRITRVNNPAHLLASHIKPWREADNEERLCAGNGLLLTPSIDHLFDRGFISFGDDGVVLISPVADKASLNRMGVKTDAPLLAGAFNTDQKHFLNYHREEIFLQAAS